MPRLRRQDSRGDGLVVPHLSDEDDIGVLPQGTSKRLSKGNGVGSYLPLIDEALLVPNQVLNGVLDGDNMCRPVHVHMLDHGRQCARFPGPRGAGNQDQSAGLHGELFHHRGQIQFLDTINLHRDHPHDHPDGRALLENVCTKTAKALHAVCQIYLMLLLKSLPLLLIHHGRDHPERIFLADPGLLGEGNQTVIDPNDRRASHLDMQVGSLSLNGDL